MSEILSCNIKTRIIFGSDQVENAGKYQIRCLSFDLIKIWCKGKFERLITQTNLDRRSAMISARKLLLLTDFVQKLDE